MDDTILGVCKEPSPFLLMKNTSILPLHSFRKVTIVDCIEKCVKRGKKESKVL